MTTLTEHPIDTVIDIAIEARIAGLDWSAISNGLDTEGWAHIPALLTPAECRDATAMFAAPDGFRSHVIMQRHGYGQGEYRYFAYPLPPLVAALRSGLYPHLAPLANDWHRRMGLPADLPADHDAFIARCHADGQRRPTPLILRYGPGDYNRLHQDLYGAHVFPIQAVVLLSDPRTDFDGGELVLTEQRPRMQSRAQVVPARRGDMILFAVNVRPQAGSRGDYRVTMRHGVSTVRAGERHALGIIFHDAA
ncbi:2OG-Fe(II) oxygenase [Sphingobium nicotianae]|uniref:2OG-Fe(II) oxygenase n=1 Tax=Sphingobium nicotianae TaxID=2782607 RepID=A0A9X1ISB4_9SPHN|nr:2OG-Fe(II) oxygenase [Sphingobium nicotianae]MBT2187995.1 2OG-Fe(II) oxygenase [Sphingobium nicotianae]